MKTLLRSILLFACCSTAWPQGHGGHGGHGGPPHSAATSIASTSFGRPTATFSAHPSAAPSQSSLPWAPPGDGDVRSPCPALNTLANHFLLPHSGKGITVADVVSAFAIGQNFDNSTCEGAAKFAVTLCSELTGTTCTTFDLDMLDKPHLIEHDNSLSREDYNFGQDNNTVFSERVWGQVLGVWRRAEIIDFALGKAALEERVFVANKTDAPGWYKNATANTLHETAFYLSLFGDPVEGNARKDWINVWFEQERMPFELGWNATQRSTVTSATLAAMVLKIEAA